MKLKLPFYQKNRLFEFDPFSIRARLHCRKNLMRCYSCKGVNDYFNRTGFCLGWAVSNTCGKCLKEQANAVARCELCHEVKPRGNACFYKFPDAGPGGMDLDGFCCDKCAGGA